MTGVGTQREDHVKTQGEVGHLQAKERLQEKQPCQHLDLGLRASRTVVWATQAVTLCWGSPNKLIYGLPLQKFTAAVFDYNRCVSLFASMNSKCSLPTKPLLSIMPTGRLALGMRTAPGHIGIEGIEVLVACACLCLVSVHLFATPWAVAHQPPLSMEFSRQEYRSELPSWSQEDPGIKPKPPALQADSLPSEPPGKPLWTHPGHKFLAERGCYKPLEPFPCGSHSLHHEISPDNHGFQGF